MHESLLLTAFESGFLANVIPLSVRSVEAENVKE